MKLYSKLKKRNDGGQSILDSFSKSDQEALAALGNIRKRVTDLPNGGFELTVTAGNKSSQLGEPSKGDGRFVQDCDFGKLTRIAKSPDLLKKALASGEVIETMYNGDPVIQDAKMPHCSVPAPKVKGNQITRSIRMEKLEKPKLKFPTPMGEMKLRGVPSLEKVCYESKGKQTTIMVSEVVKNTPTSGQYAGRTATHPTEVAMTVNHPQKVCGPQDLNIERSAVEGNTGMPIIDVTPKGQGCSISSDANCMIATYEEEIKKKAFEKLTSMGILKEILKEEQGDETSLSKNRKMNTPIQKRLGGRVLNKYQKYLNR